LYEYLEYYPPIYLADQVYLLVLLMLFSLVMYLFIKNKRDEDNFILNSIEQKAYLRAISTYTRTAIAVIDESRKFKFANTRFLKLFHLTSAEVEGKKVGEVSLTNTFYQALETDENHVTFEMKNGTVGRKVMYKHPITTQLGQWIGDLILIGPEIDMETIVNDDPEDLKLEKLSHNLKTPLNAIMGYSQLLLGDKDLDTEQRKYLHTITQNSTVLLKQIDTLLNEHDRNSDHGQVVGLAKKQIDKILIVDDVSFNRTLMRIMLERQGYCLDEAKNGKEALEKINQAPPDLVLMDITMPVMDGLEALKEIRKSNRVQLAGLPVIAVTAQSRKGNKERLLAEGFDGYLQKPFKEEELMQMIKS